MKKEVSADAASGTFTISFTFARGYLFEVEELLREHGVDQVNRDLLCNLLQHKFFPLTAHLATSSFDKLLKNGVFDDILPKS